MALRLLAMAFPAKLPPRRLEVGRAVTKPNDLRMSHPITPSLAPEAYAATTVGVSQRGKLDYWQDAVCRHVVGLAFQAVDEKTFDASVRGARLPALSISHIEATAHEAVHASPRSSAPGADRLVFNFVLQGQMRAEQDGRSVLIGAGDVAVCDAERPYLLCFDNPFDVACVTLPREAMSQRLGGLRRSTAVSLAQRSQLCPLVFGYAANLTRQASQLSEFGSEKVSKNFTELLIAMVDEIVLASPLPLSEYRAAALVRVKDFVERHATDAGLDAATVAAALKLSPRYINQLLEAEGTSLARYLWRRRVERAAADLRNPALQARGISTIAMANGFNDLSHFSKAFRQRYAVSPRDYRHGRG